MCEGREAEMICAVVQLVLAMADIEHLVVDAYLDDHHLSQNVDSFVLTVQPIRLEALQHLSLSFVWIPCHCLDVLADCCPNIEELIMRLCRYLGLPSEASSRMALSRLIRLRLLDLGYSVDANDKCATVEALLWSAPPSLETLVLDGHPDLSDDVMKHIAVGLPRLRALSLRHCGNATDTAFLYLADTALRELIVAHHRDPEWLRILTRVDILMGHI
jgi:hypothetical protein